MQTYGHHTTPQTYHIWATHQAFLTRVAASFAGGVSRHPGHGNADPRLGVISLEVDFVARDLGGRNVVCIAGIAGIVGVSRPISNGGDK